MVGFRQYLSWACALSLVGATTTQPFEKVPGDQVPSGWTWSRTPAEDDVLKLRIAVRQRNVARFEQVVLDISDPAHQRYGKHLPTDEIKAMLRPKAASTRAVLRWLKGYETSQIHDDGDMVTFATTVGTANRMLSTQFEYYRNTDRDVERLRTLEYSLPESLFPHVDFVQPTTRFGSLAPMRSTIHAKKPIKEIPQPLREATADIHPGGSSSCNDTVTPTCLAQLYNIHYKADPTCGNKLGYASFLEQYARYSDLSLFEQTLAPWARGQSFNVTSIHGGLNDQTSDSDSGEANLDNQYIVSLGWPTPVIEFSTAGRGPLIPDLDQPSPSSNENEPYLDYLNGLITLPSDQLPQVISHSYGEDEQSVPPLYNRRICNMFAQLGARGVSIIFSSGDAGVGTACQSNDGKNKTEFQPQFPAACPWVTSVGGTQYISPEQGTYFSGGGFSRLFPQPTYQAQAVSTYLDKLGDQFSDYINPAGRAFPDVAAQAFNYKVYDSGSLSAFEGTSCAAPVFASIISLLNAARIVSGQPTLGFLNPWLYGPARAALNDITLGGNTGCNGRGAFNGAPNGSPVIPSAGFNATVGWDPVTGLGTPDFGKLLEISTPGVSNTGGFLAS